MQRFFILHMYVFIFIVGCYLFLQAIDVWLATCLIFVFTSLLEYGFANYLLVVEVSIRHQAEVNGSFHFFTKYKPKCYIVYNKI